MSLHVGAVIVTYNCCEKVISTFRSVLPQVERIIFMGNGSCDHTLGERVADLLPRGIDEHPMAMDDRPCVVGPRPMESVAGGDQDTHGKRYRRSCSWASERVDLFEYLQDICVMGLALLNVILRVLADDGKRAPAERLAKK